MRVGSLVKALSIATGASVAVAAPGMNAEQSKLLAQASKLIFKDVAIIGGGASGAYSAVRLREDMGKSVVVIEKAARMVS
jgi:heterodisulfide reductase subunit A-like polyferredoxin